MLLKPKHLLLCFLLIASVSAKKEKRRKASKKGQGSAKKPLERFYLPAAKGKFEMEFKELGEAMLCSACKHSSVAFVNAVSKGLKALSDGSDELVVKKALLHAWNGTCATLPQPIVGAPGKNGPEFRDFNELMKESIEIATNTAATAGRSFELAFMACTAVMYDFRDSVFREVQKVWSKNLGSHKSWQRSICGPQRDKARDKTLCPDHLIPPDEDLEDDDEEKPKKWKDFDAPVKKKAVTAAVDMLVREMASLTPAELPGYLQKTLKKTEL